MPETVVVPQRSLEAERSVLGSMLRRNDCISDVAALLRVEHFWADACQKVYAAMLALWDRQQPVDAMTLADELHKRKQLDDIGGYVYLATLLEAAPTAANVIHYAGIIHERFIYREIRQVGAELQREADDPTGAPGDLLERAEQQIFALSDLGITGQAVYLGEAIDEAADALESRATSGESSGLPTGFNDLDAMLAGLRASELVVVGGRPSTGKTSFVCGLVNHVAVRLGRPVYFVSLEMSRRELAERFWSATSRVDSPRIRGANLNPEHWSALCDARHKLKGPPLLIDDTPCQTMQRIAANARRFKRKPGIELLVLDYLQLVEPENRKAARWEQVGAVSRRLKLLARELKIPVVALAQLKRESEKNPNKQPHLSDLRNSGDIEQDADLVMLLHKSESPQSGPHTPVEILIAKNRNGPVGGVRLLFHRANVRFDDDDPSIPFDGMPFSKGSKKDNGPIPD